MAKETKNTSKEDEQSKKELIDKTKVLVEDFVTSFKRAKDIRDVIVNKRFDGGGGGDNINITRGNQRWEIIYIRGVNGIELLLARWTFDEEKRGELKLLENLRITLDRDENTHFSHFDISADENSEEIYKKSGWKDSSLYYTDEEAFEKGRKLLFDFQNSTPDRKKHH